MANRIALYRLYRPKNFDELYGQKGIVQILKNAIISDKISHAYLFSGPRGTGKTSAARILAKTVNCLDQKEGNPDNKCQNCQTIDEGRSLDIIELDAASHTQVDNIREVIIERAHFMPTTLKYKVYIIDEAHMLSKSSFNALLKTLEEPPKHTIFILATTEPYKLPETITSRCQRFDFKRISMLAMEKRLREIATSEKINIDDEALKLIAKSADGGFRDAISYLDQISASGKAKITLQDVEEVIGFATQEKAMELIECWLSKKTKDSLIIIKHLIEDGHDIVVMTKNLLEIIRKALIDSVNGEEDLDYSGHNKIKEAEPRELIRIMEIIMENEKIYRYASNPSLSLEVASVKIGDSETARTKEIDKVVVEEKLVEHKEPKLEKTNKINGRWNQVMLEVKSKNNSIHAFLKACQPEINDDNTVCLYFPYRFHKERIDEEKNRAIVEKAFENITGEKCRIKCILKQDLKITQEDKKVKDDLLEDALEIFGGEVID